MSSPPVEEYLIYKGRSFQAEWYFTEAGEMPALIYYQREMSEPDRDRMDVLVRYFCDRPYGQMLPKTVYNVEDKENQIYALKPNSERFFNFLAIGGKIIVTNAYHKQSQKMSRIGKEKLKVAVRCREDYLRRIGEGTYYA